MMTMPEIERCLRQLRLSGVRDTLQTRVLQAQGANQPFLETFSLILQDELDRRQSRLIERRYQQSGLDEKLTLAEFDWSFNPKLPRQTCFQLHTLAFIAAGENALLVGKPESDSYCPSRYPLRVQVLFDQDRQTMVAGTAAHARRA
jgi:DNA replication protein DnaC